MEDTPEQGLTVVKEHPKWALNGAGLELSSKRIEDGPPLPLNCPVSI
jgi:hypothetical protein